MENSIPLKVVNLSKKNLKIFNKTQLVSMPLKESKDIHELNLSENHLESTDSLFYLTNLMKLNLSSNLITKLTNLPKSLVELNVSNNQLDKLLVSKIKNGIFQSPFDQMVMLEIVNLSKNNIKQLNKSLFSSCSNLQSVDLSFNHISDSLECFVDLPQIYKINLDFNKIGDLKALNSLKGCVVKKLSLIGNVVTKQPQKCDEILREVLPQILILSYYQDRSFTPPQPKQNKNLTLKKELSEVTKKNQKDSESPFQHRFNKRSTSCYQVVQRQLSFLSIPNFNIDSGQVDPTTTVIQPQEVQGQVFQQPSQSYFGQENIVHENKQNTNNLFYHSQLNSNTTTSQQQQQQQQLFKENDNNQHQNQFQLYLSDKGKDSHKSCSHKIQKLKEQQTQNEILIKQQADIIEELTRCQESNHDNSFQNVSFAEFSTQEECLKKKTNIVYITTKFDIILLALAKLSNSSTTEINQVLMKLLQNKPFLDSSQRKALSLQILEFLESR